MSWVPVIMGCTMQGWLFYFSSRLPFMHLLILSYSSIIKTTLLFPLVGLSGLGPILERVDRASADLLQRLWQPLAILRLWGSVQHCEGGQGFRPPPLQCAVWWLKQGNEAFLDLQGWYIPHTHLWWLASSWVSKKTTVITICNALSSVIRSFFPQLLDFNFKNTFFSVILIGRGLVFRSHDCRHLASLFRLNPTSF